MIRRLLVCAPTAALIASPAIGDDAGVAWSGTGELRATYLDLDDWGGVIQGGEARNYWTLGGGGSLDAAWKGFHAQADFGGEGTLGEESADDTYEGSYGGGLHLNLRDSELGSVGLFGAVGKIQINDTEGADQATVVWGVGGEAQLYLHALTFYAQGGYLDRQPVEHGGDPNAIQNAGFGRLVSRVFFGDDLELAGEGSFAAGRNDPDGDSLIIAGWGAGSEYRLGGTPVSVFLRYTGAYFHQSDDVDNLIEHRIGFGVRVYFGQPSLRANDRHGASLDLPPYLEWNGQAAGALE